MLKSMTGFGKSECSCPKRKIIIEIKSLNSKQLDLNARIPNGYREKEMEMRTVISDKLKRGKVDFFITVENNGATSNHTINKALAQKYYHELKELSSDFEEKDFNEFLPVVMRLPDVLIQEQEDVSDEEWMFLKKAIEEAVNKVDEYRIEEGKTLEADLVKRNDNILALLEEVKPFEKQRIETLRAKIKKDLAELGSKEEIDKNRFEQELVYYQDKLDITEEKIRLRKNCEYFLETLQEKDSQGKKLAFISQEIGREINTLGSKASNSSIQKIVVQMKDELEKIKEQLFNIL